MIKIRKKPCIVENEDRWGRLLGTYYVNDVCGEVTEEFWKELQEFENYSYEEENLLEQFMYDQNVDNLQMPKAKRLLKRSMGQIWQFNMIIGHPDANTTDYIRSYAVFGQKTLKEHTFIDSIHAAILEIVCKFKNLKAKRLDQ